MAFLCPSRLGYTSRAKRNRGQTPVAKGRLTGSDSIETVELIGLQGHNYQNTRTKLEIVQDFNPKAPGEVLVRRGELVRFICTAKDWLYIKKTNGKTGYVPQSACCAYTDTFTELSWTNSICSSSHWSEYSADLSQNTTDVDSVISRNMSPLFKPNSNHPIENKILFDDMDVTPFYKTSHGQYVVLFDFIEQNENDTSVERAELVEVLNIEDPDWSWVRKYDSLEGFVPKTYICPVEPLRILVRNGGLGGKTDKSKPPQNSQISSMVLNQPVTKVESSTYPMQHRKTPSQDSSVSVKLDSLLEKTFDRTDKVQMQENFLDYQSPTESSNQTINSSEKSLLGIQNERHIALPDRIFSIEQSGIGAENENTDNLPKRSKIPDSSENSLLSAQNKNTGVLPKRITDIIPETKHLKEKLDEFQNVTDELAKILKKRKEMTESVPSYSSLYPSKWSSGTSMNLIGSDQNLTTNENKMSNMVEYVIKYEYKGNSHGQQNIYVQKGEAVYADLNSQNSTEWIWVYIPRTNQYGYIPTSYAAKQKTVVL